MRVLIIGANGLVGRALCQALIEQRALKGETIEQLMLLDHTLPKFTRLNWVKGFCGDLTETALLRRILADGIDVVFHVASVSGGLAEQDDALGYSVNLQGTLDLLNQLHQLPNSTCLIYASSIAVYGGNLPQAMDENYLPQPELSYGTHKLMVEMAIRDLTRRG